jgi:hypothetical protein
VQNPQDGSPAVPGVDNEPPENEPGVTRVPGTNDVPFQPDQPPGPMPGRDISPWQQYLDPTRPVVVPEKTTLSDGSDAIEYAPGVYITRDGQVRYPDPDSVYHTPMKTIEPPESTTTVPVSPSYSPGGDETPEEWYSDFVWGLESHMGMGVEDFYGFTVQINEDDMTPGI